MQGRKNKSSTTQGRNVKIAKEGKRFKILTQIWFEWKSCLDIFIFFLSWRETKSR